MSASLRDRDGGAKALIKAAIRASLGSTLKVGILAAEGAEQAEGATDGTTLIDVATWNEFGTATIPERSFVRAWYDDQLEENKKKFRALFREVLAGRLERAQMWEQLGLVFVADIQKRIVAGIDPPNAASTIARKGSSTPLVDKGQLKASVTYEVEA